MKGEPISLTAGVLIIGSLMWDSENGRPAWRADRLDTAAARNVTASIRYGRISESRGNSYTMVLSRPCPVGRAKLVPCSHTISTVEDLIAEAECLWKAEQPGARPHRIASTWGCVALLCNPGRQIPEGLLKSWAIRVAREPGYEDLLQALDEGVLISKEGLLQIDWPLTEGGAGADLDVLFATATRPTLKGAPPSYPSAETIANAWNVAGEHVEYFWKNRENEITTFQDDEIRALLLTQRVTKALNTLRSQIAGLETRLSLAAYANAETEQAKVLRHFLERALQISQACELLGQTGMEVPLMVLMRVACEDLFLCCWVARSENDAAEYCRTIDAETMRLARIMLENGRGRIRDKSTKEDKTAEVLSKLKGMTTDRFRIEQLAEKLGLQRIYDVVYRLSSFHVHGKSFHALFRESEEGKFAAISTVASLTETIGMIADNRVLQGQATDAADVLRALRIENLGGR